MAGLGFSHKWMLGCFLGLGVGGGRQQRQMELGGVRGSLRIFSSGVADYANSLELTVVAMAPGQQVRDLKPPGAFSS